MKLYQIKSPDLTTPTFAAGTGVAELLRKQHPVSSLQEMPDPPAPAGATILKVSGFQVAFMPQYRGMMLERIKRAQKRAGYFVVQGDQEQLCISPSMRDSLIAKLEAV